jgi:hypothetical protein
MPPQSLSTWLQDQNRSIKAWCHAQNWRVILALVMLTAAFSVPVYFHRIVEPVDTDYGSHVRFTQQLLAGESLEPGILSHPVLQLLLAGMHLASGRLLGLYASLILLQVLVQVATALILYDWFGPGRGKGWDWLRGLIAFSLTFAAPVMLLAGVDGKFYYGYIGLANYHNPTLHLLKPVALLSLRYAVAALEGRSHSWRSVALAAFWMVLSAGIKPNYALSIIPALALAAALRALRRCPLDWKTLAWGFAVPGAGILALQWLYTYLLGDLEESIVLAPLVVEGAYSEWLLPKALLSILFPLAAAAVAGRQVFKDAGLSVGWAGFLAGAAQFYLLAEGGRRMMDANFRWSGQIMLFLLFAVSARWVFAYLWAGERRPAWERWVTSGAYLAHLAGGAAYYLYCMVSIHYR